MSTVFAKVDSTEQTRVASRGSGRRMISYRTVRRVIMLASILLIAAFLVDGFSYYMTPYSERPHHDDYRALKPAGSRGLVFGLIGSVMMIVMHLYSVRRRARFMKRLGGLRYWLDFHIFMGIMGPLFILLHTSFKFNGLVAISFWSMVAVALSGFVGRYLFQQIPRSQRGDALSLEELQRQLEGFPVLVGDRYGLTKGAIARISELSEPEYSSDSGALRVLWMILVHDLTLPSTIRRYRRELKLTVDLPDDVRDALAKIVRQQSLLRRRIVFWQQLRKLFHYWHVVHKPFAIVMYVIMAVHIGVAVWTGYGWFY